MITNLSICPNGCGVRHENGVPTKTNCTRYTEHANASGNTGGVALAVPKRRGTPVCPRHGGPWGDDETCEHCTDEAGTARPMNQSGPLQSGSSRTANLVDQCWEEKIDSLNDAGRLDGEQIGEDFYHPFIETDDGRGYHEVGYTEYLDFHNGNHFIDPEFLESGDDPDADGWLNGSGEAAVETRIEDLLTQSGVDKDIVDSLEISQEMGGDEPNFTMTLAVPSDADMTVHQMFDRIVSPFFGAMKNGTDPGTFGHTYLFSDLKTPDSYFLSLHDDAPKLDAMREKRHADYTTDNRAYNTVPELIALKRSGRLIGGEAEGTAADWTSDESASIKQAWKHGEHRDLIEEYFPGEADEARRETERGD